MALNKRLLRKVRNRIAKTPESYDQGVYYSESHRTPCGAKACLAGEGIICSATSIPKGVELLKKADREDEVAEMAQALFGITNAEAEVIFWSDASPWPAPHAKNFQRARTLKAQAQVAVAYLDECLKRGEVTW